MVVARRTMMGGGGAFTTPEATLLGLYNGQNGDGTYYIGAASRIPGEAWVKHASNPIFSPGTAGAWDDAGVKDPWLVHDGSQYVMYYGGHDGSTLRIGRATASSWSGPYTRDASNPVATLGSSGAFDDSSIEFPVVLYEPSDTGREWKMWYSAVKASDGKIRIGYAYSTSGRAWTKFGQVIDVGAGGTWNDEGVSPTAIAKSGSTYNLLVGGRQGTSVPRWQGGVWTFTDPEGTYTAHAGNPVLLARFNDSAGSSMTATTSSGSAVVRVADTSWANVGEAVVIVDGSGVANPEVHEILTVDSSTQVTLMSPVTATFNGTGGVLRSLAFNSVAVRTVRAVSGGYEAYGIAFQPIDGLTAPVTLYEGSLRWTASALTGPWSYDYTTGLMFPLYPANTGWDKFSAENPSVIAAP